MLCLYVAGTMTESPLRGGVHFNVRGYTEFVWGWEHD